MPYILRYFLINFLVFECTRFTLSSPSFFRTVYIYLFKLPLYCLLNHFFIFICFYFLSFPYSLYCFLIFILFFFILFFFNLFFLCCSCSCSCSSCYCSSCSCSSSSSLFLQLVWKVDGRSRTAVRPLSCSPDVLPSVHGSSFFQRGDTHVLCTTTLGTRADGKSQFPLNGAEEEKNEMFYLHYDFPPYCTGETGTFTTQLLFTDIDVIVLVSYCCCCCYR